VREIRDWSSAINLLISNPFFIAMIPFLFIPARQDEAV